MTQTERPTDTGRTLLPGQDDLFGAMFPPPIKWDTIGEVHVIAVAGVGTVQDRDYQNPDKLLFWPDGQPKMVTVVYGPCDDGPERSWWIRGKRATTAMREGAKAARIRGLAKGDLLAIVRGPDDEIPPKSGRGDSVFANTYEVTITPADGH